MSNLNLCLTTIASLVVTYGPYPQTVFTADTGITDYNHNCFTTAGPHNRKSNPPRTLTRAVSLAVNHDPTVSPQSYKNACI